MNKFLTKLHRALAVELAVFAVLALALAHPAHAVLKSVGPASGGGGGSGTVTSVGLTAPSVFAVSGSPVTTAGTIGLTFATGQTQNMVLASPDGTGGAVGLRSLTLNDLPSGLGLLAGTNTWTGANTFTYAATSAIDAPIVAASVAPEINLNRTSSATDAKWWSIDARTANVINFRAVNDAGTAVKEFLSATRAANVLSNVSLGNATDNPTYTFLGTGTTTINSSTVNLAGSINAVQFSGQRLNVTSTTVPVNGVYLPAASTLGFSTHSTAVANFNANGMFSILNAEPRQTFDETDQSTDLKNWDWDVQGGVFSGRTRTDADAAGKNWLAVTRGTTTAISDISLGNATDNPTYEFLGTGSLTVTGGVAAARFVPSNSTVPANGMYLPAANNLGLAAGSTREALFSTTAITFGEATNNPTFTFSGTGVAAFGGGATFGSNISATGNVTGQRFTVGAATVPTTGIYLPTANTLGFSTNTTARGSFDANGLFSINSGLVSSGTKFTTTGCSVSSTTGGATAGFFTLGANTCTVVVTMAGATGATAPNGWTCTAHDRTQQAAGTMSIISGESTSSATTASFVIPVTVGATDIISFSCTGI